MKQAVYNISAIQGDTWPGATFTITVNGAAINLSGGVVGAYIGAFYTRIASTGTAPVNNPFVIAVGLHYKRDGLGSRTMYIK